VISDEEGPRLVAAIELVSPANKDRAAHRQAFVTKCAAYLQAGVSVVTVDIVTSRTGNLAAELVEFVSPGFPQHGREDLYAVALRMIQEGEQGAVQGWTESLAVGSSLPTLPLWLNASDSIPLDLEQSYSATCRSLRIAT
jgi:hypothetical protein